MVKSKNPISANLGPIGRLGWPIGPKSAEMGFFWLDHKITSDFFVKMNYFHLLSIIFWCPELLEAVIAQTANRP